MTMIKTGLIGHPVSHSKSPLIHEHWIAQYGLDGSYVAHDVPHERLAFDIKRLVEKEHYQGFNVTVPHKQAVMALCDSVGETARAVGAVNTVVCKSGQLHGMNTDVFGFVQNIKDTLPGFMFGAGPVVVLGAGGAACAAVYGLLQEGVPRVFIVNRSKDKAASLSAAYPSGRVKACAWDEIPSGINMVVNTTPLGMDGYPPLDLDLSKLPTQTVVYDIVYAPLYTDLLCRARDRGHPIVTGIGMLLHQARPAFKAWFGIMPEVDDHLQKLVLS